MYDGGSSFPINRWYFPEKSFKCQPKDGHESDRDKGYFNRYDSELLRLIANELLLISSAVNMKSAVNDENGKVSQRKLFTKL